MNEGVQVNRQSPPWPDDLDHAVRQAVQCALQWEGIPLDRVEIGIQLTVDDEVRQYNQTWRGIDKTTNVLSFALAEKGEIAAIAETPWVLPLGDILLAFETIRQEASLQDKAFIAHLTHLVVHGTLHLLGYDHERGKEEARQQETREIAILAQLQLPNPYV